MKNELITSLKQDQEEMLSLDAVDNKLAPLNYEIGLIMSEDIQQFVRSVLFHTDDLFWTMHPSDEVGEYPPDEYVEGGNILHIKRMVGAARMLANAQAIDGEEMDVLIAACLLHDIAKAVEINGKPHYDYYSAYTSNKVIEWVRNHDSDNPTVVSSLFLEEERLLEIMRLIRCQNGIYSPIPETVPMTNSEWIIHFAEVISRNLHNISESESFEMWRMSNDGENPEVPTT